MNKVHTKNNFLEEEIAKDFKGITKNRSIKIGFLKKHARTNLFVSKVTGKVIPQKINSTKKNLSIWNKRHEKKIYNSNSKHHLTRLFYTTSVVKDKLNKKNIKIADLGCGGAGLIKILNKFYGLNKIHGFEYSKTMCLENKKKFKNTKIKFINSSIEKINEKKFKNFFDIIFLTWTLGSSSKPDDLIKKTYKILKSGGILIVAESSRILVRPRVSIFWYLNNFDTFKSYPWRFSFNSLRNLLLINNIKIIRSNNYEMNNNLVVIGKKLKQIKNKNFRFDNYKKVINFFRTWIKISKSKNNNFLLN